MSLLAASQSGLDPTQAYGIMQNIQAEQQAQNQQRQERQAGLIGMLQEAAMGGMPYAGAEALMDAAPGPLGPGLQSALEAMYPGGGPPPTGPSGATLDFPTGSRATIQSGAFGGAGVEGAPNPYAAPNAMPTGPQAVSPAYQPEPMSFTEQQAQMEMAQEQETNADLIGLQTDAAQRRAENWTVDQFIAEAQKNNPELFATAPEDVMAIIENTFGSVAVDTRGMPGIGQ